MDKSKLYSGLIAALVLSVLAVVAMFSTPGTIAAQGSSVRLIPDNVQMKVGDSFTLELWVNDVTNLNGVDFHLIYDTSYLEVLDADPYRDGTQIITDTFPFPDPPGDPQYKNQVQNGEILYKVTQVFPHPPVSGSGISVKITLKALKEGPTTVRIDRAFLYYVNGTRLPDPQKYDAVIIIVKDVPCYTLTREVSPPGSGTIVPNLSGNCLPTDSDKYLKDTQVSLTAVPFNEFVFTNWSGDVISVSNPITLTVDRDKSIVANYTVCYTLTTSVYLPEGGTVGRSPQVNCYTQGTSVTLTALPNPGFVFDGWSGDVPPEVDPKSNPIPVIMDRNRSITANFKKITNGTVSVTSVWTKDGQGNPKSAFNPGDSITYAGVISNTYTTSQAVDLNWSAVGQCGSALTHPEKVTVQTGDTSKDLASSIYGNACPGAYTFQLSVTHNSVTSSKSTTFTVTMKPGLDLRGSVRLNGVGLGGVKITARIQSYPDPTAITDKDGNYKFDFIPIQGDAWATVWAELTGYTFKPTQYSWRHADGYELRTLDFVATLSRSPKYHVVSPGETLSGIASKYGVSTWTLACANGIRNPSLIYAGQLLVIPYEGYPCYGGFQYNVSPLPIASTPASAPTPAILRCIYVVTYGDTLNMIAARFGVDASSIARANGLYNINWIYPGQRLLIPGCM